MIAKVKIKDCELIQNSWMAPYIGYTTIIGEGYDCAYYIYLNDDLENLDKKYLKNGLTECFEILDEY